MSGRSRNVARRLLLALDAGVLLVATWLAFAGHDLLATQFSVIKARPPASDYVNIVYAALPVWLVLVSWLGLDDVLHRRLSLLQLFRDLVVLHVLGFVVVAALLFLSQGVLNRLVVALFLVVNFTVSFMLRALLMRYFARQYERGPFQPVWLLVGEPNQSLRQFVATLQMEPFSPRVLGVLCDAGGELPCPHLGAPGALVQVLHQNTVDLVVFFPPHQLPTQAPALVRACEEVGVSTAFAVDAAQRYSYRPALQMAGGTPLLSFDWLSPREFPLAIKHVFDVFAGLVVLLLLSPVLLLTALAVRVSMGAPIFFGQERVGLHGRRFKMWKFRSMVQGAEAKRDELLAQNEMSGPVFKVRDDPRVTPMGRFIRKWSIDELPQLVNVLLGEMSLVGPRPLPLREQQDIEGWYRRRLSMRPGITGLWQVSGRSGIDFDAWMKLDLQYVDEWSLLLDLKILLLTLPAVIARRGAS